MDNSIFQGAKFKFKLLGIYQVVSGIIGIIVTAIFLIKQIRFTGISFLVFLIVFGLYFYSIYCGVLLLKRKTIGLNYSLINQYLQVINFSILGYAFKYIAGVYLSLGIDLTNTIYFNINCGISEWQIYLNNHSDTIVVNLNLVAVFLVIFINKIQDTEISNSAPLSDNSYKHTAEGQIKENL